MKCKIKSFQCESLRNNTTNKRKILKALTFLIIQINSFCDLLNSLVMHIKSHNTSYLNHDLSQSMLQLMEIWKVEMWIDKFQQESRPRYTNLCKNLVKPFFTPVRVFNLFSIRTKTFSRLQHIYNRETNDLLLSYQCIIINA